MNIKILFPLLSIICYSAASCQSPGSPAARSAADTVYTYASPSADGIGKLFCGREISQVMGAAGADWLERPEREREENPALAISKMGLSDSTLVADIGAGTGYYSFAIAARVPKGQVYAVDVQPEMIDHLNRKKAVTRASNVTVVKGDSASVGLPSNAVDLAIFVDVYHELEYPFEIMGSVLKSLKPGGRVLLIEYRGEDPSIPIKPLHKTTIRQLTAEFKKLGFRLSETGNFLPVQHFLIFTPVKK